MNQVISLRSTGFSAAHHRDAGVRWLAEQRGFNFFMNIQTFLFSNAHKETNENSFLLSVMHFIFFAFFQLNISILVRVIKEMSTLMQPTGENNRTQQIREVFKFNIYYIIVINFLKFRGQR